MSFGFGVGDFLDVIKLVTQLRKDFADAPTQLRDLSAELRTFSILLQDTEVDLTANELDSRQVEALESTLSSAREFLKDLQGYIDKNKEIPKSTGSKPSVNLKRIWKRLSFDQQEVSKFRHQISSIIAGLQLFSSNEVKHNTRKIARYVDKQEHRDVLKWLSDDDFNYHTNYQSHLVRNRQTGTRKWLLDSDEWGSWLKMGGKTLYCPGIPGSGKTFTTAMVIENIGSLSEEHGWVFAYVFCNYQQRRENMCEILLRSLLRMVLEQTQEISDEIQRWPTRNKEISIDEIIEQLRVSMKGCSRVFFMVDALDELDVFQDLVSHLSDLQKAGGVNLYFTSRKIPHIQMLFEKEMIVPIKATEHDVGVYLEDQMSKPHVPSFVRINQALRDDIKKTVVNAVGEMFLLADLQVTQLMQSKSTRRLQNALKAITSGRSTYETTYEAAMDRIRSQDERQCELALNAISILAYAERPLLAPELVHALSVDLDFNESSYTELYKTGDLQSMSGSLGEYDPDLMPSVEDVLAASAGLIVHQPDSDIMQLVHKTTKEYLMSDDGRRKWFPQAQLTIAAICLIYSQAFECSDDAADWAFLDYAQKYYGHHIMAQQRLERGEGPATIQSPRYESASGPHSPILQARQLIDQIGLARMAQELGGTEDVLIVASKKNQLNFARVLLSTKQYSRPSGQSAEPKPVALYVEADCAIDRALLAAVRNGYIELVDLLLKHGANPMIKGLIPNSRTVNLLAMASFEGHHNVVAYLLDHGYFTMAMMQHDRDGFGRGMRIHHDYRYFDLHSPICFAASSGHVQCVEILWKWIEVETNANGQEAERDAILERVTLCALAYRHVHVLKILPRLSDATIASMFRGQRIPNLLFLAIKWAALYRDRMRMGRNLEAVPMFILRTYDFDLSVRDGSGVNALALSAEQGMSKLIRLILEERRDLLNSQDSSGRTPISWAIRGSMKSVHMLLDYDDIQSELLDNKGLAPVDYLLKKYPFNQSRLKVLPPMILFLEDGINRLDLHGCTLVHALIDTSYSRPSSSRPEAHEHWEKLGHYKGLNIFEGRAVWDVIEQTWRRSRRPQSTWFYTPRPNVFGLRQALGVLSTSTEEVRSSPCKCGVGSIFLAISTENVEVVKVLLEYYPDLVNDKFFDGSSPLDLAECIHDPHRRQSMVDLILSKIPAVDTDETESPRSDIGESDSGDAQQDCSLTDLELVQRRQGLELDDTDGEYLTSRVML